MGRTAREMQMLNGADRTRNTYVEWGGPRGSCTRATHPAATAAAMSTAATTDAPATRSVARDASLSRVGVTITSAAAALPVAADGDPTEMTRYSIGGAAVSKNRASSVAASISSVRASDMVGCADTSRACALASAPLAPVPSRDRPHGGSVHARPQRLERITQNSTAHTTHHTASHHTTSHRTTRHHTAPHHTTSHHTTSHHIAPHHTTPHRTTQDN